MPYEEKTIKVKARHKGSIEGWSPWSNWSYVNVFPLNEQWVEIDRESEDVYIDFEGFYITEPSEDDVYVALRRITRVTFERQNDGAQITQVFDHWDQAS